MEQRFTLSEKLTAGECLLIVGFTGALVTCALCAVASLRNGSAVEFSAYARLTVYLAVTALMCALLRITLTKDMRQTQYVVSGDSIAHIRPQRIVTIPLEGVERLRYIRTPFFFNFGLLSSPGGAIRISFRTRDHAGLVALLKSRFDAGGKSGVYKEKEIERYLRDARFAEQADARLRRLLPALSGAIALSCAVNTMTALFLWWFPVFLSLLWSVFGLLMFVNAVRYAEYVLGRTSGSAAVSPDAPRSVAAAYLMSGAAVFTLYLACGIALKAAFFR
ncbi:MAG TPA: hypothetical protein VKF42_09205 [Chitinivibrionales bacterium]|jgi:hypothetical protein|nr:hypothetical protein [Chitinivibrionales bacterium]